jgi:hypothetical protein
MKKPSSTKDEGFSLPSTKPLTRDTRVKSPFTRLLAHSLRRPAFPSRLNGTVALARMFHELLSRDRETGDPLAGLSGAQRARRGWACHLATRPAVPRDWSRGVPERYVAGADTRGRQEGRPYPRSQQVIHETSGLSSREFLPDRAEFTAAGPLLILTGFRK